MLKGYLFSVLVLITLIDGASVLAQESRPETGTFGKDTIRDGLGELTIINDNHKLDALAVLTNLYKVPLIAVYIRSNESFKISGIVDGTYGLYFKLGNKWYGNSVKFTEKGGQYRLDRSIDFKTTQTSGGVEYSTWTVALEEAVPDANMAAGKVPVSEEDFPM